MTREYYNSCDSRVLKATCLLNHELQSEDGSYENDMEQYELPSAFNIYLAKKFNNRRKLNVDWFVWLHLHRSRLKKVWQQMDLDEREDAIIDQIPDKL